MLTRHSDNAIREAPIDGQTGVRLAKFGDTSMSASLSSSDFSSFAANGVAPCYEQLPHYIATLKHAAVEMRLTSYLNGLLGNGDGISMDGFQCQCASRAAPSIVQKHHNAVNA
jgi:hypothetical protein